MDVDYNESYFIKSELNVQETFSYCGSYEDYGSQELKTELVNVEKYINEEDNLVELTDVRAVLDEYICNECNFTTTEKDSLIQHLNVIKNVQHFCKDCNFKTLFGCLIKERFRIHKRVDCRHITKKSNFKKPGIFYLSPQGDIKCSCKEYDSNILPKGGLKENVKIHTDEYKCKRCNYKTPLIQNLKKHMKIHTGYKYKCSECDYKTVRKDTLKRHMKIHTGYKYKCSECDYKTVRKDNLKAHLKIHTGDEYKCKECDYKTQWKQSLKAHLKIHTGDQYKCKECNYKTRWEPSLKIHLKIHTGDEHKCKECDYKTVWKMSLKGHLKIHTSDEYKCMECDYKTLWKQNLKRHIEIHMHDKHLNRGS
ncbi:hypothetical protein FQA39_LY08662 [Lamprigera yunnana]|nr:hypothetical protein FQA39_LY08662 [Lamprigera yunnana]